MNYLFLFLGLAVIATIGIVIIIIYLSNKTPSPSTTAGTCTPACINGMTCVSGQCQSTPSNPSTPGCGSGPACIYTDVCQSDECVAKATCSSNLGCITGESCINGLCTPNTCDGINCSGMMCINNICQFCTESTQCQQNESCILGYCVPTSCETTCSAPGAPDVFTCISNKCYAATNNTNTCTTGTYLIEGVCMPSPAKCEIDTDCGSEATACYMGTCLPTCDVNAPNACIGGQVCAPQVPSTYYPGGENFISLCMTCDDYGNCMPPYNMVCELSSDCPDTFECNSGYCTFVPQENNNCTALGYSMVDGVCTRNKGVKSYFWQNIDLLSKTPSSNYTYNGGDVPLWALMTDTSGRMPSNYSVPNVIGMVVHQATDGTKYYTLPTVFIPNKGPIYGPQFGYFDYWNGAFYSWDSGSEIQYAPSDLKSAAYMAALNGYSTPLYSGAALSTINDTFMTYNGVPFCYNAPANDNNDGPSVFTALTLNKGPTYKYNCIIPFQTSNNEPDTHTEQFGDASINPVPVYRSCVNGVNEPLCK